MPQTDHDIFPEKEKEKAKRKKIADMNAVTANTVIKAIIDKYGFENEHYQEDCVNGFRFRFGKHEIDIKLLNSLAMKWKDILPKLLELVSCRRFISEIMDYIKECNFTFIDCISSFPNIDISYQYVIYMNGITEIYKGLFPCNIRGSISIPDGVTVIGAGAFYDCSSLKSISIPDRVIKIGESAFSGCSSVQSINISNGVTVIRNGAFSDCSSLKSINIPEGVAEIEICAFFGCSSLESINILDGVIAIGKRAFFDCSSLKNITYSGTMEQWRMLSKGEQWNDRVPAKVVHCSDGDISIDS